MRICVIFNPVAKGNKARRFRAQMDDFGREAVLKMTRGPEDARRLAAEAVAEGFDCIVAAGGDGTLNEVLNGIGDIPDGFERAALGVLPLGTVNVFARELLIPLKLADAWKIVLQGREARIDLACAEFEEGGIAKRRYFAQLAGAGLDARAIQLVNWNLKKRFGPLAYIYAGLKALLEQKPTIRAAGRDVTLEGQLVLVGNGRLYGGDFKTFEQARTDDGFLDVCVFPRVNFWTLLQCAGPLLFAGKLPDRAVRRFQAGEFTLSSMGQSFFELDGELAGGLPVKLSAIRCGLRVVAP